MGLLTSRIATTILFTNFGFVVGTWVSSMPGLKEAFSLTSSGMGLMIFMSGIGAGAMAFPYGRLVDIYGPQFVVLISGVTSPLLYMWLPSLASLNYKPYAFVFVLSLVSAGGVIAMNTRASEIEILWRKPIMSSFHAAFSLGGVIGSSVYALLLKWGLTWTVAYPRLCITCALISLLASIHMNSGVDRSLLRHSSSGNSPISLKDKSLLDWITLGLGCMCFLAMMTEGAIGDWSALYFLEVGKVSTYLAPLGYSSYAVAMSSMRFIGDIIIFNYGRRNVFRVGGCLAFLGLATLLTLPNFNIDLLALVLVGCGMSNMVPIVMSTAGRHGGASGSGLTIATVSVMGQVGLLTGPCVIGFLADLAGTLRVALCILLVTTLLIMCGAPLVKERSKKKTKDLEEPLVTDSSYLDQVETHPPSTQNVLPV